MYRLFPEIGLSELQYHKMKTKRRKVHMTTKSPGACACVENHLNVNLNDNLTRRNKPTQLTPIFTTSFHVVWDFLFVVDS